MSEPMLLALEQAALEGPGLAFGDAKFLFDYVRRLRRVVASGDTGNEAAAIRRGVSTLWIELGR